MYILYMFFFLKRVLVSQHFDTSKKPEKKNTDSGVREFPKCLILAHLFFDSWGRLVEAVGSTRGSMGKPPEPAGWIEKPGKVGIHGEILGMARFLLSLNKS